VHRFFLTRLVPEYFQSAFDGPGDVLRFVAGTLSRESLTQFKASLERLAAEFEVLARNDARLPLAKRNGCSAVLAVAGVGVLRVHAPAPSSANVVASRKPGSGALCLTVVPAVSWAPLSGKS